MQQPRNLLQNCFERPDAALPPVRTQKKTFSHIAKNQNINISKKHVLIKLDCSRRRHILLSNLCKEWSNPLADCRSGPLDRFGPLNARTFHWLSTAPSRDGQKRTRLGSHQPRHHRFHHHLNRSMMSAMTHGRRRSRDPNIRRKAAPPELPTSVTPAVVPKRNKMTMPTAFQAARETLSHYVPTTVEPVPRPVPPPAIPVSTDISILWQWRHEST